MKKRTFSYVRAHRAYWSLSSKELARLLGRGASMVTRIEKGAKMPGGRAALGCQVIFGVAPQDMFPRHYEEVEETIMARAVRFHQQLEGKTDRKSARKRELLADMMKRATGNGRGA
jgi:transcriptional regulator with XRE-family HTH domain